MSWFLFNNDINFGFLAIYQFANSFNFKVFEPWFCNITIKLIYIKRIHVEGM